MGGGGTRAALAAAGTFIGITTMIYAATAFVTWEASPSHWSYDARLAAMIVWAICAPFLSYVAAIFAWFRP